MAEFVKMCKACNTLIPDKGEDLCVRCKSYTSINNGEFITNFNMLARGVFEDQKHWYEDEEGNSIHVPPSRLLLLMVSEICESYEGIRKDIPDDHLPHRSMEEVEMADLLIRFLAYCGWKGYDVDGAFKEKMVYNKTRPDHQRENRNKPGGKKF